MLNAQTHFASWVTLYISGGKKANCGGEVMHHQQQSDKGPIKILVAHQCVAQFLFGLIIGEIIFLSGVQVDQILYLCPEYF